MNNAIAQYRGLPRNVYLLFVARTINSLGDFVFAMITMYLTLRLDLKTSETGVYLMLAAITTGPGSLLGGYLCDKIGRRTMILTGQLMSAILTLTTILYIDTMMVAYLLIASVFCMSLTRPAYIALFTDYTSSERERKSAFSLLYIGINIGAAIGPFVAGLFFVHYIKAVFIGVGMSTLISTIIVFIYIRDVKREANQSLARTVDRTRNVLASADRVKYYLLIVFIIISISNYLIYFQHAFSMPIQINALYEEQGPRIYGLLMTINSITVLLLTPFINLLTKKVSAVLIISIGALLYGIGFWYIFNGGLTVMIVICTIVWTMGEIMIFTNINIYIAQRSPVMLRGRFNGMLLFIGSLGFSIGSYYIGNFIEIYSIRSVGNLLLYLGIIYAVAMILFYLVDRRVTLKRTMTDST